MCIGNMIMEYQAVLENLDIGVVRLATTESQEDGPVCKTLLSEV